MKCDRVWLRERQRTRPELFSRLSVMSTLGIRPAAVTPHWKRYNEFARLLKPLSDREVYGKNPAKSITPNWKRVNFANAERATLTLEFDQ